MTVTSVAMRFALILLVSSRSNAFQNSQANQLSMSSFLHQSSQLQHPFPQTRTRSDATRRYSSLTVPREKLFSSQAYDSIQRGQIAIIPNFITPQDIASLKVDAQNLWNQHSYATDALASYGKSGTFDPARDRAVLKVSQWNDSSLGSYTTRHQLGARMAAVRADLAYHLNRPHLDSGLAATSGASTASCTTGSTRTPTSFGYGSTEISYTRFGPGAYLKRHVDEHHEELKDTAGWMQPTRRSISWLIYLNEKDWDSNHDGGQLRCYPRASGTNLYPPRVGSQPNGDLQIGWLRPSSSIGASTATATTTSSIPLFDPIERPVFLNAQRPNGKCAMYTVLPSNSNDHSNHDDDSVNVEYYITRDFDSHPILYMAGGGGVETWMKSFIFLHTHLAHRFDFIELPHSNLDSMIQWLSTKIDSRRNTGIIAPSDDEVLADITPVGGTLVLFDSVSLPHEVLPTKRRERWATSGWFHEDQQSHLAVPSSMIPV